MINPTDLSDPVTFSSSDYMTGRSDQPQLANLENNLYHVQHLSSTVHIFVLPNTVSQYVIRPLVPSQPADRVRITGYVSVCDLETRKTDHLHGVF